MNIIEAIKSGKPFKRSLWTRDYVRPPFVNLNLPAEDLLADDWEVEEASVQVTNTTFVAAFNEAVAELDIAHAPFMHLALVNTIAKKLGL